MTSAAIRVDIFPTILHLTDPEGNTQTYEKVRMILTLDHVYAFQDGPTITNLFDDRLTSYTPPIPATRVRKASELLERFAAFETEDGYTGKFLRMGGCGCGAKLKKMDSSELLPQAPLAQAASVNDSV